MSIVEPGDRIFTVPNILSFVRILALPIFIYWMLVTRADAYSFVLLVISGTTDFLDGKLARLLDQASKLGAILDPFVDRLYLLAIVLTFGARHLVPWWLVAGLIARDVILTLTIPVYRRRGLVAPDVIYLGKGATFALMSAFPWILAGQTDWAIARVAEPFGYGLLGWGASVYYWTAVLYIGKAVAVARRVQYADGVDSRS